MQDPSNITVTAPLPQVDPQQMALQAALAQAPAPMPQPAIAFDAPQGPTQDPSQVIALTQAIGKSRGSKAKSMLTDALTNFVFSLSQGMSAAGQVPGGPQNNSARNAAALGGSLGGAQLLQQIRAKYALEQQQIGLQQQNAQSQATSANANMIRARTAMQPQPQTINTPFELWRSQNPQGTPEQWQSTQNPQQQANPALIETVMTNPQAYNNLPATIQTSIAAELAKRGFTFPKPTPASAENDSMTPQQVTLDGKPSMVLRDSRGDFFEIGTKAPVTGRITPYIAPPTPRQKGEITPTAEAGLIQSLNKRWEAATKDVQSLYRANTIMQAGLEAARRGDLNAGAQAVLITFQKFLDPQSVVRESEYARSAEGLSMANRISGYIGRLSEGGAGVPLKELETFAKLAQEINNRLAGESNSLLSAEKRRISSIADRYEIPNEMVITGYDYATPGGVASPKQQATMAATLATAKEGDIITVPKSAAVPSGKVKKVKGGFEAVP